MLTDSEIHASLRRLEDADYISEQVMSQNLSVMADNVDEVDQRLTKSVNDLNNEAYQLHTYIEPHLYNDDLQFFQTIYIGSFMVSDGGYITGDVTIDNGGSLTVDGTIMANNGVDIYDGTLFTPSVTMQTGDDLSEYTPHTFTIEGTPLTGTILSTQDMSFSLVGLVEGNASDNTYTMRTIQNHIDLLSVTVEPHISYDEDTHKYYAYANLKNPQGTVVLASTNVWSGTEAYDAGGSGTSYSHSATLEWFETVDNVPHFKKTSGDRIGYDPTVVYW